MRITGYERTSLVDWPGRVAAVLFLPGCNMDCFYCHNRRLIGERRNRPLGFRPDRARLNQRHILADFKQRADRLDGVVITGGEPTLQPGLITLIDAVRGLGLPVKLDTNGTNPGLVRRLLQTDRLACVALDIKAAPEKYAGLVGPGIPVDRIRQTFGLIDKARIDYEVRTTCVPQITLDDLDAMGRWMGHARRWVLQAYRPLPADLAWLDGRHFVEPHGADWFRTAVPRLHRWADTVVCRGVEMTALTVNQRAVDTDRAFAV